ncbi:hypothetical protein [Rhodanobacter sp. B04]|nr:hypothetical protein [Rhodanobacter sp. B04]
MTNYSGHPQGIPLWGKRGGAGASPGWGFIFVAASPEVFLVAGWPA